MKRKKLNYLILIIAGIIFLFSLLVFFSSFRVVKTQTFYASVNVTKNNIGFDVNESALTFGNVPKPGSSTRSIIFENGFSFPVSVGITVKGDIGPLLNFNVHERVEKGETKNLGFTVVASQYTPEGFYDGTVKLDVKPSFIPIFATKKNI